jgi:hypothetical protein
VAEKKYVPVTRMLPLIEIDVDCSESSKNPTKLPRRSMRLEEVEARDALRRQLITAGLVAAALALGIVIGRFVLS